MMHVAECRIVFAVPRHVLGRMGYSVPLISINNQEYGINEILSVRVLWFGGGFFLGIPNKWKVASF